MTTRTVSSLLLAALLFASPSAFAARGFIKNASAKKDINTVLKNMSSPYSKDTRGSGWKVSLQGRNSRSRAFRAIKPLGPSVKGVETQSGTIDMRLKNAPKGSKRVKVVHKMSPQK